MAQFSPAPRIEETAVPWLFLWVVPVFVASMLALGAYSETHRPAETRHGRGVPPGSPISAQADKAALSLAE